jgi:MFS family permease
VRGCGIFGPRAENKSVPSGAIIAGAFGLGLGRPKMIFAGTIIMTIGVILQTTMTNVVLFIVARVITGLGNGKNQQSPFAVFVVDTPCQA